MERGRIKFESFEFDNFLDFVTPSAIFPFRIGGVKNNLRKKKL